MNKKSVYLLVLPLLYTLSAYSASPGPVENGSLLNRADVCWTMAGLEDNGPSLKLHGEVVLGMELTGAQRDASLAGGGDGKVADFHGGYLSLADDEALELNNRECTLAVRLRDPSGKWEFPILGSYGSDKQVSLALRAVDGRAKPMWDRNLFGDRLPTIYQDMFMPGSRAVPNGSSLIEVVWGAQTPNRSRIKRLDLQIKSEEKDVWPNPLQQDTLNAVMKPCFPVGLIGSKDWYTLLVRFTGPKLQLFIDGVLVDEEFPVGTTRKRTLPFLIGAAMENGTLQTGFNGQMDYIAIWNRAITDDEIATLSDGAQTVRERELAILGPEPSSMQYFYPRGHNRKAGDCIPYWDAQTGTFRLFYLILRRNMHSKWDGGHGGLEIWQASTKDLKTWTHHPVTIPVTEQWEAWNGTGAVEFHNGQYNWFYPSPDYDGSRGGIQRAVSQDGVTFTKVGPHPFLPGGDLEIFRDDTGLFNMLKVGPDQRAPFHVGESKTLVAWVRLADLNQRGGSVLTLESPDGKRFDGMVFGERSPRRWMPGSDCFSRTPANQFDWPQETSGSNDVVQLAVVYDGNTGSLYRNGEPYASYAIRQPVEFPAGSSLVIGKRHSRAGLVHSFFHGRVLDARLYGTALSAKELAGLKPDVATGPKPLAWYDFENGSLQDRAGSCPAGKLIGNAHIKNGELVVGDNSWFMMSGFQHTEVRMTSPDLETWTEQPGVFRASEKRLSMCPNVFRFGKWHYYMCGTGVWKSDSWFGPWTENVPLKPDCLSVPKTAAFGKDRRIYAGFLGYAGWGGNEVLRELVQDDAGNLGTRFVKEMIPATGNALSLRIPESTACAVERDMVELKGNNASVTIPGVTGDYRIQAEIVPSSGVKTVGIEVKVPEGEGSGLSITVDVPNRQLYFGDRSSVIADVPGLNNPFKIDVVVRYDIVDVEVAEFRSDTTRFWQPDGKAIRLFSDGGGATFRNLTVRPITDSYVPYPAMAQ